MEPSTPRIDLIKDVKSMFSPIHLPDNSHLTQQLLEIGRPTTKEAVLSNNFSNTTYPLKSCL